jgi:hypothetical protein
MLTILILDFAIGDEAMQINYAFYTGYAKSLMHAHFALCSLGSVDLAQKTQRRGDVS